MKRLLSALITVALLAVASPAHADGEGGDTSVDDGGTTFDAQNSQNENSSDEPGSTTPGSHATPAGGPTGGPAGPEPVVRYVPVCLHGEATVEGAGFGCPSGEQLACGEGGLTFTMLTVYPDNRPTESSTVCLEPGDLGPGATAPPIDVPGEALKAFKKVELPESAINIQPPDGETLVNFKTILLTRAERHQIEVRLDKVNIDLVLEVWPSHFLWHHGDETTQESTIAGAKWTAEADVDGADFITHTYTQMLKAAQVSVDTTWSARFKVVGDPDWRPVDGTVTKVGAPVPLAVLEATPELVIDPN